jgi:imidazolonepropionase
MQRFLEADSVWLDVNLTTLDSHGHYGVQRDMALSVKDGVISAIEPMQGLGIYDLSLVNVAGRGGWLTPGFIDCHTHLVFAGNRAREFEQRLQGIPYETIAKQGGGILSTVMATRRASEQALFDLAVPRLRALMADGVTTVEIKSGYGLSLDDELKLLRVAKQLEHAFPVRIITTLLGAHALPPEYQGRSDDYIDLVCQQMIPKAVEEGLVNAVDMFCEGIGFSVAQCEKVIQAAQRYQLPVKGHTEQLSDLKGSQLVASYGGLSVDHLEYLDPTYLQPLIDNQTVAVLLPGAFYFLKETQKPPIQALRDAGIPMAVATDFNPGTSPFASLRWMMNMACTLFQLTPEEALAGVTCHAARALNLHETVGMLSVGMRADMLLWNIEHPAELAYQQGIQQLAQRIYAGEVSYV